MVGLVVALAALVVFGACSGSSSSRAYLAAVERFQHQSFHISYRVNVPGDDRFANGAVLTIDGSGGLTRIELRWDEQGRGMRGTFVAMADGGESFCGLSDDAVSVTSDCRVILKPFPSGTTTTYLLPTAHVLAQDDEVIDAERATCWKLKGRDVRSVTTQCLGDGDGLMLLMSGEGASDLLSLMVSGWGTAVAPAVQSGARLVATQMSSQPALGAFTLSTPPS